MKIEIGENLLIFLNNINCSPFELQKLLEVLVKKEVIINKVLKKLKPLSTTSSEETYISKTDLLEILN